MEDKNSHGSAGEAIRVIIFDQAYSLRSPKGAEHVKQIAQLVDERMRQISAHTTTFELSRIAVLAALNIADELEDLRNGREDAAASDEPSSSAQPPAQNDENRNEENALKEQTWFEAIFDAEVPVKERSERLSSQVSSKLQTIRQENSRDASTNSEESS